MTLLLKFFLAHILGDFVFQPAKWVADKQLNKVASRYLYFHVLVHAVALVVVLQFDWTYSIGVLSLLASHVLIDLAKVYLTEKIKTRVWFFLDQLAHITVIVVVVRAYEPLNLKLGSLYAYPSILLLTALVLLTFVSAIVIKILVAPMQPQPVEGSERSLENAGRYIGILERLFVFAFIVLNHWEAVGFLLAAKSVFRFGDLRDAHDIKLTEYILIGTLISFGIAILIAVSYQYLLGYHHA